MASLTALKGSRSFEPYCYGSTKVEYVTDSSSAPSLIDYEALQRRLIWLVKGLSASMAVGHLVQHLRYLDVAVEDYETAVGEYRPALDAWMRVSDVDDARPAPRDLEDFEVAALEAARAASVRLYYRVDCSYTAARRVLDRVVVVVNQLLRRTETDLGNSHADFRRLLTKRCAELELSVPESLLEQIDDLNRRVKRVRDLYVEHPGSPLTARSVSIGAEHLRVGAHKVIRPGDDDMAVEFEPAEALRVAVHEYVQAVIDLVESSRESKSHESA